MALPDPRNLSFEAELVEVFERDGRHIAKLLVHSFFVEVDAQGLGGAHLGDRLLFNSRPAPAGPPDPTANEEAK
jgi:hypothetical protein